MTIPLFAYIHLFSYPVPATVGIMRFARFPKAIRTLAVLTILSCVNIAAQYFLASLGLRNYFVGDYYTVIETCLLCAVFYWSVASRRTQNAIGVSGILFVSIWILDRIFLPDPEHLNSKMAMLSRLFLIAMSFITLHASMKDETSRFVDRPVFWVALGVSIYALGTLLLLGLSSYLLELGPSYFIAAWHVNWSMLIVANLLYTKGMLCKFQV